MTRINYQTCAKLAMGVEFKRFVDIFLETHLCMKGSSSGKAQRV
jgi:hypothetical protein